MNDYLNVLQTSVDRLRGLVTPLDDAQLVTSAFPAEWSVADVLSHLGSSAVIMQRRLEDSLRGAEMPDDFPPSVWDVWNAKNARAKADDALAADRTLLERLSSTTESERGSFKLSMGPLDFDFDGFVSLRLNEHALHTWDVEVAFDPDAVVPSDVAALVVDKLELVARFTAKPTGNTRTITARTTDPTRDFTVELTADAVTFTPAANREPDVELPAEAWVRLVYGRLDRAHSAGVEANAEALDELRRAFPGP